MTTNIIKKNGHTGQPARTVNSWVDQMLQDNLNRFFNDDFLGFPAVTQPSRVPVNIRETENSYELELAAPGLRKEDFKLQASNDLLTISYEQKEEQEHQNQAEGWLKKEYSLQSFTRSFNLDDTVDMNKISAEYNNGLLRLTLPKKENARKISKTIEIK